MILYSKLYVIEKKIILKKKKVLNNFIDTVVNTLTSERLNTTIYCSSLFITNANAIYIF